MFLFFTNYHDLLLIYLYDVIYPIFIQGRICAKGTYQDLKDEDEFKAILQQSSWSNEYADEPKEDGIFYDHGQILNSQADIQVCAGVEAGLGGMTTLQVFFTNHNIAAVGVLKNLENSYQYEISFPILKKKIHFKMSFPIFPGPCRTPYLMVIQTLTPNLRLPQP